MIIEDIKIMEKIYDEISNSLLIQNIEYKDFTYQYYWYENYSMSCSKIVLIGLNGEDITDKGVDNDAPELSVLIRKLRLQMEDRGDNWKSMSLKFISGKVTINFSDAENPPP